MDEGWPPPAGPDLVASSTSAGHWLRTPTVAVSTVGVGLAAHAVGGEGLPRLETVLFLAVVTGLLWSTLAKTAEESLPRMVVGVGSVQLALQVALLGHQPSGQQHSGQQHSGHERSRHPAGSAADVWAAHAVAAVLLAWWLRRGEGAFWRAVRRVIRRLAGRLGPTLATLATPKPVPPVPPVVRLARPRTRYVLLAAPRRGPPLAA